VIEKYFGQWKAEGPQPNTDLPAVPLNRAINLAVPTTIGCRTASPWRRP